MDGKASAPAALSRVLVEQAPLIGSLGPEMPESLPHPRR